MFLFSKVYESWTWERISRHVLYWCGWWGFYALVNTNSYRDGSYVDWLLVELFVLPVKLTLTYFVIYYLLPRFSKKKRYFSLLFLTLTLSFLGAMVLRTMEICSLQSWLLLSGKLSCAWGKAPFFVFKMVYKALDLLFVVSLVAIIKFIQQQFIYERKTKSLLTQKLETELQFLKHQLQPHFLFNTLNNLYGLILTKSDRAGDMVVKLSEIMSYMLYESNETLVPVEDELANLENYIALEKIRYGDELQIDYKVKGETKEKKIPPLVLISFVENAFKHGPSSNLETSWIRILAEVTEKKFLFVVENSFPDLGLGGEESRPQVNSGIGLDNVQKRLDLIYGTAYDLKITQKDTYLIELSINYT
jgi:sensor histidine kinase YesM